MYLVRVGHWRLVPKLARRPVTSQLLCARCRTLETGDRETQRHRDRETEGQRESKALVCPLPHAIQGARQRDREAERQRGSERERQRERESNKLLCARCHTLYPIVFVGKKENEKRKRGGNDKKRGGKAVGEKGGRRRGGRGGGRAYQS
jgi:hypothetical protein